MDVVKDHETVDVVGVKVVEKKRKTRVIYSTMTAMMYANVDVIGPARCGSPQGPAVAHSPFITRFTTNYYYYHR